LGSKVGQAENCGCGRGNGPGVGEGAPGPGNVSAPTAAQQALDARETKTVAAGKASGEATAGAWEKEHQGQVIDVKDFY